MNTVGWVNFANFFITTFKKDRVTIKLILNII